MTSQEDRERFAPLFGFWPCLGCGGWNNDTGICRTCLTYFNPSTSGLPDFCDIRGPYFGPACEELIRAGWTPGISNLRTHVTVFYWLTPDGGTEIDSTGHVARSDPNLDRCTMLALEEKRKMEKENV